eukprot:CAMPEP_0202048202 /NCGR_PEP_ID=MMETSP0963-20130614/2531_1 /ASSEMBLY_ACC=CAM_ASM_000494 /TAXON_ID=4773 /ORGANISM="Schizochytrium aggregatum, Strain ATCC28209" /LENGTH=76 /DNA_ID=CAMNT_0048613057 /DNA_START=27 /DNA_END=253 /DNA_ORIENTATION=-
MTMTPLTATPAAQFRGCRGRWPPKRPSPAPAAPVRSSDHRSLRWRAVVVAAAAARTAARAAAAAAARARSRAGDQS